MPRSILIGIDLGTTVLKTAAFCARTGEVRARVVQRLDVAAFPDGRREQDPQAIVFALRRCLGRLRRMLGPEWRRVSGLGLAAQGGSATLADRATGRTFTPMILWNDGRAHAFLPQIRAQKPVTYWYALTLREEPGAGLGRMLWLQQHYPQYFTDRYLYAGAGELLFFHLTGQWRQDAGNALQIGCYDAGNRRLDEEPLRLVGVPLSFVAPMREGHETFPLCETASRQLGLPAGIPVAGPYMDHEAGFLAVADGAKRPLQCSLGTAWVGNFLLPYSAIGGSPFQLVLPAPVGEGRLVVQPLLTGNVAWDWGLELFVHADHRRALALTDGIFRQALLPPYGLVALPWLGWTNPLVEGALGGGMFVGMNLATGRADLIRALAAGLVFEFARVFEEVKKHGVIDRVVLGGGASKGWFFSTLLAGLFAPLPVFTVEDEDIAGARGTLAAHSATACRARLRRLRGPTRAVRKEIERFLNLYCNVFTHLCGHVLAGDAFRFERRSRKKRCR